MNEKQTTATTRPTKKQQELLTFIGDFIAEHGYSPSYREIMTGLDYTSVATVALHVGNLIQRGHLQKRHRSARSLELAEGTTSEKVATNQVKPNEEKWLIEKVDYFFAQAENSGSVARPVLEQLYVLLAALKVLGLDAAAQSFAPRIATLKTRVTD